MHITLKYIQNENYAKSGQTVNGDWTDWGNWSGCDCDHSAGTGTWNRTRSCTNPPPSCYGT